jgi:hypothetical protein
MPLAGNTGNDRYDRFPYRPQRSSKVFHFADTLRKKATSQNRQVESRQLDRRLKWP